MLAALEEVITTVTEAETGQRGYVITEQDLYLSEVDGARDENVVALDKVKKLTADNADQQQNLARLTALVASRFAELQAVLELAKNHDAEAARARILEGRGREQMVEIRALVDEMQLAEHKLLAEREQTNRATLKSALRNVLVNVSIGIAALAAVWYLMYRYLQVVEKAATAIHNQRELLHATLISIGDGVIATDATGPGDAAEPCGAAADRLREEDAVGQQLTTVFNIVNEEHAVPRSIIRPREPCAKERSWGWRITPS